MMAYYADVQQQVRQTIYDIEDQLHDANRFAFLRHRSQLNIPTQQRWLSRLLIVFSLVLAPFCVTWSNANAGPKTTGFLLCLALLFVILFVMVDRINFLIGVLGFLGAPMLVVASGIAFTPWILLSLATLQLGLLISSLTMHDRAALHLLMTWEFVMGTGLFVLTWQPALLVPVVLALITGCRIYGVLRTLRFLLVLSALVALFFFFHDVPFVQILLILASPVLFFVGMFQPPRSAS
ncbi:MAG: hypothetical protein ACRCYY_20350 [Trueperaceae bacterium]